MNASESYHWDTEVLGLENAATHKNAKNGHSGSNVNTNTSANKHKHDSQGGDSAAGSYMKQKQG